MAVPLGIEPSIIELTAHCYTSQLRNQLAPGEGIEPTSLRETDARMTFMLPWNETGDAAKVVASPM